MTVVVFLWLTFSFSSNAAEQQPVRFYAWGGSAEVNAYIEWASTELAAEHGIALEHVRVADISEAVTLLLAARPDEPVAIDLLWINGENFAALKQANRLLGELPRQVPNAVNLREDLNWQNDFGTPVDGYELPWGIAQLQLIVRSSRLETGQTILAPSQLLALAQQTPGRFSYPKPPSFHGTSWLKALAFQLLEQPEQLLEPAPQHAAEVLAPLWRYLDQLHPLLWRGGEEFPVTAARQRQLYNQGVVDNSVTFNPNEVAALQQQLKLAPDAVSVSLGSRALTNFHYLAVPVASQRQQAALQVIQFFLSAAAQQRKADPSGWGDPSVVRIDESQARLFPSHPEPHVSWNHALEQGWLARYQR
ncbi:ABC transporter substrate-binding protein [Pseudidiomarina insulisalsae]|uniref:ABC transporter substrate-binding protein n=2 Tax=Pseudidiomarina insulisalsae TaxID=575789 RepID=A0A432YGY3_9GAMM|nr:ABC transporter substrate-binding protein [Pseudidiomarina insulisalsae]